MKKNSLSTFSNLNNNSNKTDIFKQSNFKRISDPLTKILDMINKIMFLTQDNTSKDEKYAYINKFKRKLFSNNSQDNAHLIKNEISKLINFSKETINFESDEKIETLNSTGMKMEFHKSRITYDVLYHIIEELLILNKYYENNK